MQEHEKIKLIRKTLKLTQQQLADKLGVSKQYLSRVEKGATDLSKEKVMLLCSECGISADWLFSDFGQMFVKDNELQENIIENIDDVANLIDNYSCYIKVVSSIIKAKYPNALLEDKIKTAKLLFFEDIVNDKKQLSNICDNKILESDDFKIKVISKYYFVYVERCESNNIKS